jgi:hypothetical protein
MKRFGSILCAVIALQLIISPLLEAQIARGAFRGAVIGGLLGDKKGAKRGAVIGGVAGAARKANRRERDRQLQREAEIRAEYERSQEYQSQTHANFNEPAQQPKTLAAPGEPATTTMSDIVLTKDDKKTLGVSYPTDWKQSLSAESVTAISADGKIWSAVGILDSSGDLKGNEARLKEGLKNELTSVAFQETEISESGSHVVAGTAEGKQTGTRVDFVFAVFTITDEIIGGIVFIADSAMADYYETTILDICESVKVAEDFS